MKFHNNLIRPEASFLRKISAAYESIANDFAIILDRRLKMVRDRIDIALQHEERTSTKTYVRFRKLNLDVNRSLTPAKP